MVLAYPWWGTVLWSIGVFVAATVFQIALLGAELDYREPYWGSRNLGLPRSAGWSTCFVITVLLTFIEGLWIWTLATGGPR